MIDYTMMEPNFKDADRDLYTIIPWYITLWSFIYSLSHRSNAQATCKLSLASSWYKYIIPPPLGVLWRIYSLALGTRGSIYTIYTAQGWYNIYLCMCDMHGQLGELMHYYSVVPLISTPNLVTEFWNIIYARIITMHSGNFYSKEK